MATFAIICFFVTFIVALTGIGLAVQALIDARGLGKIFKDHEVRIHLLEKNAAKPVIAHRVVHMPGPIDPVSDRVWPVRACKAPVWKCTNPECDWIGEFPDENEETESAACPKCGSAMV